MTAEPKPQKGRRRGQRPKGTKGQRVSQYPPLLVRIPKATKRQLEALSVVRQLSQSALVDVAIRSYINQLPDVDRDRIIRSKGRTGLRQFKATRTGVQPSVEGPMALKSADTYVVIALTCSPCGEQIEAHIERAPGFGYMDFYRFTCPICGKDNHKQFPGRLIDVQPLRPKRSKPCIIEACDGTMKLRTVRAPDGGFVGVGAALPEQLPGYEAWVCDSCGFEQKDSR